MDDVKSIEQQIREIRFTQQAQHDCLTQMVGLIEAVFGLLEGEKPRFHVPRETNDQIPVG
jgi:hypothetical protein